jgi:hypothetical protein
MSIDTFHCKGDILVVAMIPTGHLRVKKSRSSQLFYHFFISEAA